MYLFNLLSSPLLGLVTLLAIVIAVTVHEFAHAWTADRLGDDTPSLQGRVTLNPAAHLDPMGSILFLVFGFGWGKPVMYNPMRLGRKLDELLIALAGPASNLVLALGFNLLNFILIQTGLTLINPQFLEIAAGINVLLAAFNLLPIPPLDGSSIIAYFWPEYRSFISGQIGLIILLIILFVPISSQGTLVNLILPPVITLFSYLTQLFGLI